MSWWVRAWQVTLSFVTAELRESKLKSSSCSPWPQGLAISERADSASNCLFIFAVEMLFIFAEYEWNF